MPFNQAFSLPIELRLKSTATGVRMFAEPIKEIEALRGDRLTKNGVEISEGTPVSVKAPGQLMDIVAEIDAGDAKEVKLQFGASALVYKVAEQQLDGMPLPLSDKKFSVRVVVDRPLYEVIGGNGPVYKTAGRHDGGKPIEAVELSAIGGKATVRTLSVYPMRSIWK
jgi:fructan beta-fructosidase